MLSRTNNIFRELFFLVTILIYADTYATETIPETIKNSKFITIGLTSQYIDSPGSSFGHIFLIFHNNENIEQNATTVSFAASVVKEDNLINMFYKATNGKYPGLFSIAPLFKKIDEYRTKEQRDLYFYTLDISSEEHEQIILRIVAFLKKDNPYYFLTRNCTFLTKQILSQKVTQPNYLEIPSQAISDLNLKFSSIKMLRSNANQASYIFTNIEGIQKDEIKASINEGPMGKILPKNVAVLENYFTYQYYKNDTYAESLLKSKLTVGDSKKNDYVAFTEPIHKKFSRIALSANQKLELDLEIRPLYRDEFDIQLISPESRFNIVEIKSQILPKIKLKTLNILEIAQFPNFDSLLKRKSWDVQMGFLRETPDDKLSFLFYTGIGYSITLGELQTIGFTVGPHINLNQNSQYLSARSKIFSFLTFNPRTKLILEYIHQSKKNRDIQTFNAKIVREIFNNIYLQLGSEVSDKNQYKKEINLAINYNL